MKEIKQEIVEEFEKKFVKLGEFGDLPVPPMLVKRFLVRALTRIEESVRSEYGNLATTIEASDMGYQRGKEETLQEAIRVVREEITCDMDNPKDVSPCYKCRVLSDLLATLTAQLKDKQ